jgi:hypothetical protein
MSNPTESLARLIAPPSALPAVRLRQGIVTATAAGQPATVTVKLGGSTTTISGIRYLSSYTATTNDTVWILQAGADLLVLGKLS